MLNYSIVTWKKKIFGINKNCHNRKMSENVTPNGTIEKYLEDTIIQYLQSQSDLPEGYPYDFNDQDEIVAEAKQKTLSIVQELISDLLDDVDKTILFQGEYQKAFKAHHQYPLFDLADILPDFLLDHGIMRQLCFREILIISNVDNPSNSREGKMKGVGGMCLKVELVRGMPPAEPPINEADVDQKIAEKIKKIKKELIEARQPQVSDIPPEEPETAKLERFDEYLEEQKLKSPLKFVVHFSSEFDVDGQNAGSRIISWVDKNFHTLEEKRTEYFFKEDKTSLQQVVYFALQENKYYVKHRESFDKTNETRQYYPLCIAKDLVGEGANFILMRYLAITKYEGSFELSTMYINGNLCRNIYECKKPKPGIVNGQPMELCKIYRTIIEKCGIVHCSVTILTTYGMIVSQEWEGCPYIFHINPEMVTEGRPVAYDYIALKNVWETNMELVSKYLDCKVEAEFKMKTYLKDHPEIQDMLADYLNSVLLLKPENIMPFTQDYFTNFEPYKLPQMPYFNEFDDDKEKDGDESEMFW